jgi:hypothetical protein
LKENIAIPVLGMRDPVTKPASTRSWYANMSMLSVDGSNDEKKWKLAAEKLRQQGHPTGPDYFFTIRKMIAEHTDTTAIGPTTATAYLATRTPNSH